VVAATAATPLSDGTMSANASYTMSVTP